MTLDFTVPSAGTTSLNGIVAWRRGPNEAEGGPAGLGVEFQDVAPQLGALIDQLVSGFRGVQVLLLSGDRQDRTSLARSIKSIIATAEITQAADAERRIDACSRTRSTSRSSTSTSISRAASRSCAPPSSKLRRCRRSR